MRELKILVVDDETDILDFITYNLRKEGFSVFTAETGEKCIKLAEEEQPDAILLDIMLPGLAGDEVYRILKKGKKTNKIPVIMLTAKKSEDDVIAGFDLGVDDYITKPFNPKILIARLKNLLKKSADGSDEENRLINIGRLSIDQRQRKITLEGKVLRLTHSKFEILTLFAKNPGVVFSRETIIKIVKGDDYPVTKRAIDVHIVELRKKLGDFGKYIETVHGTGYKFIA